MKRLIAISLFITTLFFTACGILSFMNRSGVRTADMNTPDQAVFPWLFLLGAGAFLVLGSYLWHVPATAPAYRTTPVEKKKHPKPNDRAATPLDKTGTARREESLDRERQDETGRTAEGVERSNTIASSNRHDQ